MIFVFLISLFLTNAFAAESIQGEIATPAVQKNAWSFGLAAQRHYLQAYGDNDLFGKSAQVSLGYAYLQQRWFMHFTFDSIMGPYEPARNDELNVDYFGTGFSMWFAASFKKVDLRNTFGGYGIAMGLTYSDIVGRSVGKNRKTNDDPNDPKNSYLIRDYVSHITNFSVVPAFFATWLNPPRADGNSPELLKTRIEGYLLVIGAAIPAISYYSNQYKTKEDDANGQSRVVTVKEKASFTGYSAIASFSIFLGS